MDRLRQRMLWSCVALACGAIGLLFATNLRATHFDGVYGLTGIRADAEVSAVAGTCAVANLLGADASASGRRNGARVNVNAADREALCAINGIGPALADRIVLERETNGPFAFPEDLLAVNGIGRKTLEKIKDWIELD